MPLDLSGLASSLESTAKDPPPDVPGCAAAWADAMKGYASGIVPPSTAVDAAASTLEGALVGAFSSPLAAPGMEAAFAAFATTVGGGMVGFVPTPPAGPVGFAAQFLIQPPTHAAAAQAVAGIIDVWMRTGKSAPASGGPASPWS